MNILSSFKVKDLPSVEDIKSNLSKALLKLKTRQYENGLNQKKKKMHNCSLKIKKNKIKKKKVVSHFGKVAFQLRHLHMYLVT